MLFRARVDGLADRKTLVVRECHIEIVDTAGQGESFFMMSSYYLNGFDPQRSIQPFGTSGFAQARVTYSYIPYLTGARLTAWIYFARPCCGYKAAHLRYLSSLAISVTRAMSVRSPRLKQKS
jgi:hypothetical protein